MTAMARLSLPLHFSDSTDDGGEPTGGAGGSKAATKEEPAKGTNEATDDSAEAALGDAGKRALTAERQARREAERRAAEAEREAESLRSANQTEQEKAVAEARKEAAREERTKWEGLIRRTRVESALQAAGCIDPDLASLAPEFTNLKVTDQGMVEDIDSVIESFKEAHPRQFAATAQTGTVDQGVRAGSKEPDRHDMSALLRAAAGR
jgi:flagellar biosynthesis GTPase FlhF